MSLNLNIDPYYDNFDPDKNYNRILFKPGVAVQARELTQLQTTLQDQLSNLGSYTLKEGSIISGCEESVSLVEYIKIEDEDSLGDTINNNQLVNFIGEEVTGESGLVARIIDVRSGLTTDHPNMKTLYLAYTSFGNSATRHFDADEILTITSNGNYRGKTFQVNSREGSTIGDRYFGTTTKIQLSPGIIYAKGQFLRTEKISTYVHPYSAAIRAKIGFLITESIVQSNDDNTLLDPARGTYNFNAPGADRYKVTVSLGSYLSNVATPDNFFTYCEFQYGNIIRARTKIDPLNQLSDQIAKRAYEANGNYIVNGLLVSLKEHLNDGTNGGVFDLANGGDAGKLAVFVEPGKANVAGYLRELKSAQLIALDKPTNTITTVDSTVTTSYGNYVEVDEVCGVWDIDGGNPVTLYSSPQDRVSGAKYSDIVTNPVSGSRVGTAKVRHIVLESGNAGTANAKYRLYLYDIKMESGEFKDVRSIYYNQTDADGFADIVLNTDGNAFVYESNFNRFIWKLPKTYVKSLKTGTSPSYDYSFSYTKEFDVNLGSNGIVTLSVSGNESFPFSSSPSPTEITAGMALVSKDDITVGATNIASGEHIDLTTATITATSNTVTINLGGTASGGLKLRAYLTTIISNTAPIAKTRIENQYVKIATNTNILGATGDYTLGVSDLFKIRSITASSNSDYITNAIDVTDQFRIDNGQRDNYYGLASIRKKASSTLDLATYPYLLVNLDYFTRTVAGPTFACIDSYPVDDTGLTGIKTEEIPLYSSQQNSVYDLRDCIDFRPYVTNTAAIAAAGEEPTEAETTTAIAAATVNPGTVAIIDRGAGLTNPVPVEQFQTDLESYLAQGARVVLDSQGEFRIITGPQDERVKIPPVESVQMMTLATFIMPPYPSLASNAAKIYNRPEIGIKVSQVENPRYTMRDISALEKRIKNLEYYTSLSMLEREAKDAKFFAEDGITERFKNGLLVDAFRGHSVAAVNHPDFRAAIDNGKQELRSYFTDDTVEFKVVYTGDDQEGAQSKGIFHIPFQEMVYTEQLQASKASSIVIELLYDNTPDPAIPTPPTPPVIIDDDGDEQEVDPDIIVPDDDVPPPDPIPVPDPIPDPEPDPNPEDEDWVEPDPIVPVYRLLRSNNAVDEGGTVTITLEALNAQYGTTIDWTVTGITSSDLTSGSLTGTFTFPSNISASFELANDSYTDGTETLTLTLDGTDSLGNPATASTSVTINDTSKTPAGPDPIICESPYVLNSAGTACVPPACPAGYEWSAADQACRKIHVEPQHFSGNMSISPDEDRWHDTTYVDPTYNNKTGNYDQFNYDDAWNITWDGWTSVNIDIDSSTKTWEDQTGYREEFAGTEYGEQYWGENGYDYYEVANIYDTFTTYTAYAQTTTNKIETGYKTGYSTYSGNLPEDIIVKVGEKEVNTTFVAKIRPVTIGFDCSGLAPNATHYVSAGGKAKGNVTTDSNGNCSGSININEGEFNTGSVSIHVSGTTSLGGSSNASATFYGGGSIVTKRVEYDRVKAPQPAKKQVEGPLVTKDPVTTIGAITETRTWTVQDIRVDYITTYQNYGYGYLNSTPVVVTNDPAVAITTATNITSTDTSGWSVQTVLDSMNNATSGTTYTNSTQGSVLSQSNNFDITSDTPITIEPIYDEVDFYASLSDQELMMLYYEYDLGMYGGFCGYGDPMAQTFTVEGMVGGMYVSSVDLFFKSISSESDNNGITLELREVINGYPGPTVIPGGSVHKHRSDCNISTTASNGEVSFKGTTFRFPNPVFLESGKEYCIVPIPDADDPNYKVWIAELGQNNVGTTKVISKQAASGVLFTSANNRTWTAHQSEDLMFRINRCVFRTNRDYTITCKNRNYDWMDFTGFSSGSEFTMGNYINGFDFTITNGGSGYSTATVSISAPPLGGIQATATATLTGDTITGITLTNPGSGYVSAPTVEINGDGTDAVITAILNRGRIVRNNSKYSTSTIQVTDGYFASGDLVGDGDRYATIDNIYDRIVNAYVINSKTENQSNLGSITTKVAWTDTGASTTNRTTVSTVPNTTVELDTEKTVYSYSNERALFGTTHVKSATIEFVMNTTVNNLSPMVNVESMVVGIFKNDINNDASTEETRVGGSASSKYISRKVVLGPGQDAEDLIVYLDNKIPADGSVKVYAKLLHSEDDADFLEDIYWKELTLTQGPFNSASRAYEEYEYGLSDKANGFGLNGSGVVEYDVSRVSGVTITNPGSGYTSAPTVTIVPDTGGYGATAEAIINSSGVVTSVNILNPGRGYTGTPTVLFSDPATGVDVATGTVDVSTISYSGFKEYAIKIVHLSTNTSRIPKSANLRAYALQA